MIEKKLTADNWDTRSNSFAPAKSALDSALGAAPFLRQSVLALTILYVVSLTCSMAAMEITSWTMGLLFVVYMLATRHRSGVRVEPLGVEIAIAAFTFVGILGLVFHADWAQAMYGAGRLRNLALLFIFAYSLQLFKNLHRVLILLAACATLVSVYAIWQHYTGIDLWRHDHRALWPVNWGKRDVYSSIGFFNHHLTYGHSYMMILTVPWSILLLMRHRLSRLQLTATVVSFSLISTSLVFTYGRGVWIAVLASLIVTAAIVSRRFLYGTIIGIFVILAGLTQIDSHFIDRATSVFAEHYTSNEDRRELWSVNMDMFVDHPLIGVGYTNNERLLPEYYKRRGILEGMIGHAHNNYIQMLSTTGVIGFSLYIFIFGLFLMMTWQLYLRIPKEDIWARVVTLSALGAQVAFHVGGLTQFNFGDMKVQHQFIFWLGIVAALRIRYGLRDPQT